MARMGPRARLSARLTPENQVKRAFPALAADPAFEVASPRDTKYNCIAWAAGDTSRWWWPPLPGAPTQAGHYWPVDPPQTGALADFVAAFESLGYVQTVDSTLV